MPRPLFLLAFLGLLSTAGAITAAAAPEAAAAPAPTAAAASPPAAPPAAPAAPAAPAQAPAAKPAQAYSAVQKFDLAVAAYESGDYPAARKAFLELVDEGHLSAPLAHNLANIEYKSGHDGQATLWYRRALAMQPLSVETLQNLRFLRHKNGFQTWDPWGISFSHVPIDSARAATFAAAWTGIILLVWLLWCPPRPSLRWPLVTLFCLNLPVLGTAGGLWWAVAHDAHPLVKRHVLTAPGAAVYAAPAEASSQLLPLNAGSEVMPLETRGNWFYCEVPSGEDTVLRGWVRSALLEPLWPYTASPRG